MSTLLGSNMNLSDWSARLDPEGKISRIIEILNQTNEILADLVFVEGNLPDGHKTTIRSGLPAATWRALYEGVQPVKSQTVQVVDTCGMLEAYSLVDKALADLNGNSAAFRLSEEAAFIEGMNQQMASTIFYGNVQIAPKTFHGLAPRYNSLSAENAANIIDAGGKSAGKNASIWLVIWGDQTVNGIFPKGQIAGLQHRDLGEMTKQLPDGSQFQALQSHYKWNAGLSLRDWRYVVRIANIDVSQLTSDMKAGANLPDLLSTALEIPPSLGVGRAAIYCNRTIKSVLRRQLVNYNNVKIAYTEAGGKHVMSYDDIPVRRTDALLNTEDPVTK